MELGYSIHYTTPSSASYVKTFNNTSIYLEIIKDQYNEEKFYINANRFKTMEIVKK
jgi:hypothetical protein